MEEDVTRDAQMFAMQMLIEEVAARLLGNVAEVDAATERMSERVDTVIASRPDAHDNDSAALRIAFDALLAGVRRARHALDRDGQ